MRHELITKEKPGRVQSADPAEGLSYERRIYCGRAQE
jgi:hypothetical protein